MDHGEYREVPGFERRAALAALDSGDVGRMVEALLGLALHDPDWNWIQDLCIRYSDHPHANVRGIAVLSFGHVARIHAKLETGRVLPILRRARQDPDPFVRGQAHSALEDVQSFVVDG